MNAKVHKFYDVSPWIALFAGTICFVLSVVGDQASLSLRLVVLVYVLSIPFQLAFLAALPFAAVKIMRTAYAALGNINFAQAAQSIDGQAIAQNGQQIGGILKLCAFGVSGWLKSAMQGLGHAVTRLGARFNWPLIAQKLFWVLANTVVTLLPVIVIFGTVLIVATFVPRRNQTPELLSLGFTIALPFLFLSAVALKTKFGMLRFFSYSPAFLKSVRKGLMLSGPVIAVIAVVFATNSISPHDRGWMILLGPMLAVQIIAVAVALGLAILPLELLAKRARRRGQPPPPDGNTPAFATDPI